MTSDPRRTCLGCRQVRPKAELVRLVRSRDGQVMIDVRGSAAGRGAYACPTRECLERALRPERLSHALRQSSRPPGESVAAIMEYLSRR